MSKIKYVFYSYADMLGGSHRSMYTLARELMVRGNDVTIVTPGIPPDEFINLFSKFNIIYLTNIRLWKRSHSNSQVSQYLLKFFKISMIIIGSLKVSRVLKLINPDVLYFNDAIGVFCFAHELILKNRKSILYLRSSKKPLFLNLTIHLVDKIFFVSQDLYKMFSCKQHRKFGHKLSVVHTGFDLPAPIMDKTRCLEYKTIYQSKIFLPTKRQKILLLGSYDARKGHLDAIKMLSRIPSKDRPLMLFAGPQSTGIDYINKLEALISELNLENDVLLLDVISEINHLFNEVDITILPSECEGLPRALIESLCFGVQAVAYEVSGVNEIITNSDCGIVVSPSDLDHFAKSVEQLLLKLRRQEFDDSARSCLIRGVRHRFTLENFIAKFENDLAK